MNSTVERRRGLAPGTQRSSGEARKNLDDDPVALRGTGVRGPLEVRERGPEMDLMEDLALEASGRRMGDDDDRLPDIAVAACEPR